LANVAALGVIREQQDFDVIFQDAMSHDSIVDFSKSFGLPVVTFAHRDHGDLAAKLKANLKAGVKALGFLVDDTVVPMVSFALGKAEDMERVHEELLNLGIVIRWSHYVGAGPAGVLRAVVFSTHTNEQIDRLLSNLKALI